MFTSDEPDGFDGEARSDGVELSPFEHESLAAFERGAAPPPPQGSPEFRAWSETYHHTKNTADAVWRSDPLPPDAGTPEYQTWLNQRDWEARTVERIAVGDDPLPRLDTPEYTRWVQQSIDDTLAVLNIENGNDPELPPGPERAAHVLRWAHENEIFHDIISGLPSPPFKHPTPESIAWYKEKYGAARRDPATPDAAPASDAGAEKTAAADGRVPATEADPTSTSQADVRPPSADREPEPGRSPSRSAEPARTRRPVGVNHPELRIPPGVVVAAQGFGRFIPKAPPPTRLGTNSVRHGSGALAFDHRWPPRRAEDERRFTRQL